jgi:cyclic pyranopterin phosphate synthase
MDTGTDKTVSLVDRLTPRDQRGRLLRDLRISVIDRCNFRCPYCMPKERYHEHYRFLKSQERLSFEEITRLVRLFTQLGVRKLRITGGEPLLRPQLEELIGDLTTLPGVEDIALTTNGVLLSQHAAALRAAGLNRVTVSLDTLDPEIFARMAGGYGDPREVLAGIHAAQTARLEPIKVNAVVQRGVNDHTVLDLLAHFRGTGVVVRFIEYMDVGSRNGWRREQVVPSAELHARIAARWPIEPLAAGSPSDVAKRYRYLDGAGELGFISSVSQPFCGDCVRARLTSDGMLYGCLFATSGIDLRAPLRAGADDATLLEQLRGFWRARTDRYSELRGQQHLEGPKRIEMNHIGG